LAKLLTRRSPLDATRLPFAATHMPYPSANFKELPCALHEAN
jgi:hypothetical protein